MAWKMDGEAFVVENGNPVWIDDTGSERTVDYPKLSKMLSDVTRESIDRKEKLRAYETRYAALKDVEDMEAWMAETTKAREMLANAPAEKKAVEEQVQSRVAAATKPLNDKLAEAVREADALRQSLLVEKVGNAFARSEYVKKNLVDPALAADLFASKFYLREGAMVARDEFGKDLYGAEGQLATFDEAILHFVNASPYKGVLLKGNAASGSGSNPSPSVASGSGGRNPWKKDSWNLTEQNKIYSENPALAKNYMREAGIFVAGM